MGPRRVLTAEMAAQARAYLATGAPAVLPRPAATVVLLRDAPAGLEAFLVLRQRALRFAGGMHAFPGGAVEPADADGEAAGTRSAATWACLLGVPPVAATALVNAAVRELVEECELVLHPDDLHPWSRWVTPRFQPRRFDTWFFVAPVPDGVDPVAGVDEAEEGFWVRPAAAAAAAEQTADTAGHLPMLPPTLVTLRELAPYGSVEAVRAAAAARRVEPVAPGWRLEGDQVVITLPGDPDHPGDDPGERC